MESRACPLARVWAGVRPSRDSREIPSPGQLASTESRGPRSLAVLSASHWRNHWWHSKSRAGFCLASFPRLPAANTDNRSKDCAGGHGVIKVSQEFHN